MDSSLLFFPFSAGLNLSSWQPQSAPDNLTIQNFVRDYIDEYVSEYTTELHGCSVCVNPLKGYVSSVSYHSFLLELIIFFSFFFHSR